MATVVNDRDVLIMDAEQRYTEATARLLLLACSSPGGFKVAADGTATPAVITFSAVRLNMIGSTVFTASDGAQLTVNGDEATLAYANMPGNSATVTVTVGDESRPITISKVFDGADGQGSNGQRGAGTYYVQGSSWSDLAAELATPGGSVVDDQVIIWNGTNFAEARRWTGSAWVASGAHFPGDVIVPGTIIGNKLKAGTIELFAADGVTPILTLGGGLRPGFEAPGTKNSELVPAINAGGLGTPVESNIWTGGSVVTVADGKVGSAVRRAVGNEIYVEDGKFIPVDRTRTYRVRFWARAGGNANGVLYHTLRQYTAPAVGSYHSDNVGFINYRPAAEPPHADWRLYEFFWKAGENWQTGVTHFRPAFILNYNGSSGFWEIQGYVVEDATATLAAQSAADSAAQTAATAQQNAASAIGRLDNIVADGVISRDEKPALIQEYNTIANEINGIYYQANDIGLVTVRDAYWAAWVALRDYLPYTWDWVTVDTPGIDRNVFNQKFTSYYLARQDLLNAVGTELRVRAAQAKNAADAANNGLADKLSKTAGQVMTGNIVMQAAGGIVAGSLSWNSSGQHTGGSGAAMTVRGLFGHNGARETFVIDAATGKAIFADELAAAYGTFGAVSLAAGGYLNSGQSAFDTGTGFWLGYVGGVPKMSIGTEGGAAMLWDGTKLTIRNPDMQIPTITATIDGTNLAASKPNTSVSVNIGSASVSLTNAKGAIRYQWSLTYLSTDPEGSTPVLTLSNDTTATVTLTGKANTNTALIYRLQCVATDANNMVAVTSIYKRCQFGTPQ